MDAGCRTFCGAFVTVGFVISGSVPNLFGEQGTAVLIGAWVQELGMLVALVGGLVALTARRGRDEPATAP